MAARKGVCCDLARELKCVRAPAGKHAEAEIGALVEEKLEEEGTGGVRRRESVSNENHTQH